MNRLPLLPKIFFFISTLAGQNTFGQCPVPDFTIQTPVCAGETLMITNSSTNSVQYNWDFSPGYFNNTAQLQSDSTLTLSFPGDITALIQNDTAIVFLTGKADNSLYRIVYANGPGSAITSIENFGNLSGNLYQPGDVALLNEGGNWYGIVVDYGNNAVVRFELGNSLLNMPSNFVTLLNNTNSNISTSWGVKLVKDDTGTVLGIVSNFTSGTFTILNFGNSIMNTPVAGTPVATGMGFTFDVHLAHDCGNWYAVFAGYVSSEIVIANFGSSLLNTPTYTTVISNGTPSDIALINDSSTWKLLYTNYSSHAVYKYDLGSNLAAPTPVFLGSDYFTGNNPKGISVIRKDKTYYAYILYGGSNQVQCISYSNLSTSNTGLSTDTQPAGITFSSEGNYPVTLSAIDANGNAASITKIVAVSATPVTLFSTQGHCLGDPTFFSDQSTITSGLISSWAWDFGDAGTSSSQNPSHSYAAAGSYTATLTVTASSGCTRSISSTIDIYIKPVANFSTQVATCSRTSLQFTDQTTISSGSVVTWSWDFGNGDTSNVQDPSYVYPIGGSFSPSLTAISDNGCSNNYSAPIFISDRPAALFTPLNTCIGLPVQFQDQSTVVNSTIVSYDWDLGDATTSSVANPSHTYANVVGDYTVSLIIVAQNNCTDTITKTVRVNNIPLANFNHDALLCSRSNIQFTDLSSVAGDTINAYSWNFGDGVTDSTKNPVHRYNQPGTYTVTLISYSPSSCPSALYQQSLTVLAGPVANFSSTISCLGIPAVFINLSSVPAGQTIDSTYWSFGTGATSTMMNPAYLYAIPGYFTANLVVVSSSGCRTDTSLSVKVSSLPIADFVTANNCSGQQVQFTNLATTDTLANLSGSNWVFGDPGSGPLNTSSLTNPMHVFNTAQTYTVTFTAVNNYGCSTSISKNVIVNQAPVAQFLYSPTCYGSQMIFSNPGSPADSAYLWNFGDFQINQLREPAHYYAFVGNYTVNLTVYGSSGCIATATRVVTVSPIPVANFTTPTVCLNEAVQLNDNSTISTGSITSRKWYLNGSIIDSTNTNLVYTFATLNSYQVKLQVRSDIGCLNSITKTITVNSLPTANFSFTPQFGNPPLDVSFSNLSIGASTYLWNFGDGTATSSLAQPQHQYNDTGIFSIQQIVISTFGCKDTAVKPIYVIKPLLDIAVTGDSSYFEGDYFHVVARVANLGTREILTYKMEAQLENGMIIKEDVSTSLPNGPGGLQTYNFRSAFLVNAPSTLNFYCIKAYDPNGETDNVPSNNEKCISRNKISPGIETYPNPFTDNLNIRVILPYKESLTVDVLDQSGRLLINLYDDEASAGLVSFNPAVSELREGIYLIRVLFNDQVFYRQAIKLKK